MVACAPCSELRRRVASKPVKAIVPVELPPQAQKGCFPICLPVAEGLEVGPKGEGQAPGPKTSRLRVVPE